MQNFYKDIIELKIVNDLCSILSSSGGSLSTIPIAKIVVHVISVLINPVYGDTYHFPWKRGPIEGFQEYIEALQLFDSVRHLVYQCFSEFDYLSKFV